MIKQFFSLTKPGIIFGNMITVIGGFLLGARGEIHYGVFISTIGGIAFIIASGCVFNNYIDRDIDKLMERTKKRVLAQGLISGAIAIIYGIVLGVCGILLLYFMTNELSLIIACIGFLVYVGFYSLWLKRGSVYGTLIGSISGAVPPVVGYCAATNNFDMGAVTLFLILSIWQMPHSFAIAIYRFNDYLVAGIPVLPLKKGILFTKKIMLLYVILFFIAIIMLSILGYTGTLYLITATIIGIIWITLSLIGFKADVDNKIWARKMFIFSIINITLLSIMMAIDYRIII